MSYRYYKVSDKKVTFKLTQGHRQYMPFDSAYMISYVSILHRFQDIIAYFRKFKDVT